MKYSYKHTIAACFISYVIHAVIVSFAPLLFLTFHETYGISMHRITYLIIANFGVQLLTDLLASHYTLYLGYRKSLVLGQVLCAMGFFLMAILPEVMPPLTGLLISISLYAMGGGLLEALINAVAQGCPTKNKEKIMSLMHSCYSWGVVLTVLVSTAFFSFVGIGHWRFLAFLFGLLPLGNMFLFLHVPLYPVVETGADVPNYKELFCQKNFILMLLMMLCAGASEQAVAQWASAYAEMRLNVSKTMGDLWGVCGFSALMGVARILYSKWSGQRILKISAILCVVSYLLIGLTENPLWGLVGCALCGLSVGAFWPGTFSMATIRVRNGGTTMFALLAFAGDMGSVLGPMLVGLGIHSGMNRGVLGAIVFPILMTICMGIKNKKA